MLLISSDSCERPNSCYTNDSEIVRGSEHEQIGRCAGASNPMDAERDIKMGEHVIRRTSRPWDDPRVGLLELSDPIQ
ncbi:hypothetical protein Tco_0098587 [Tanacetum coccineum]